MPSAEVDAAVDESSAAGALEIACATSAPGVAVVVLQQTVKSGRQAVVQAGGQTKVIALSSVARISVIVGKYVPRFQPPACPADGPSQVEADQQVAAEEQD